MRRAFWIILVLCGLILISAIVQAEFYVIPVKKCCTCKGTLYENRWCDNEDGTVTDLTTCLVWLKYANWGGKKPWRSNTPNDYDDAHKRAGILCQGTQILYGFIPVYLNDGSSVGEWRLPTYSELETLVNGTPKLQCPSPGPCHLYAFKYVQAAYYWSYTTLESLESWAWMVGLHHNGGWYTDPKAAEYYVWPVRGSH